MLRCVRQWPLTLSYWGRDSSSLNLRPLKMTRLAGPPTLSRPCAGSCMAFAGTAVTAAGQLPYGRSRCEILQPCRGAKPCVSMPIPCSPMLADIP